MSLVETLKGAVARSLRRVATRLAVGVVVAAVGGFRAYSGADASEGPAPEPAPAARTAPAPVAAAPAPARDSVRPQAAAVAAAAPTAQAAAPGEARADADSAIVVPNDNAAIALVALGRETFVYGGQGRRDPFASLLKAGGDLRPLLTDLRLVTVLVGSDGRNSVAIMRDLTTKEQYRRRAGESLGRMRVSRIEPRQVVFTIEEFGYSRQEVLMYSDSTTTRTR